MSETSDLSYKSFGSGKRHVIFLHGYCEVKEMWDDFIPLFSSLFHTHTFISLDLPGFGKSQLPENSQSLQDIAKTISEFLKAKNINSAIWIGHSLGGYVLMHLLRANSKIIDGICMFHSSIYSDSEMKKSQRNATIDFIEKHGKEAFLKNFIPGLFYSERRKILQKEIERSIKQGMENSELSMIKYMEMMRDRPDLSDIMQKQNILIHFIAGRKDSSVPLHISEKQAKKIEQSSSLFLNNCAHMGMFENPDLCLQSIHKFVTSFRS